LCRTLADQRWFVSFRTNAHPLEQKRRGFDKNPSQNLVPKTRLFYLLVATRRLHQNRSWTWQNASTKRQEGTRTKLPLAGSSNQGAKRAVTFQKPGSTYHGFLLLFVIFEICFSRVFFFSVDLCFSVENLAN